MRCTEKSASMSSAYKNRWKFAEGKFYINDFISFDEQLVLTKDSVIRFKGEVVAKLVSVDEKYLVIGNGLETGTYCSIGEIKEKK